MTELDTSAKMRSKQLTVAQLAKKFLVFLKVHYRVHKRLPEALCDIS
jgi:hypothetical protein